MKNNGELAPPSPSKDWTRADDYLGAMARRRTARKARRDAKPRTEPEAPRFLLSTLPFLVLIGALLVITVGIAAAAWPVGLSEPEARPQLAQREPGTAPRGWFDEAKKDFH